MEIQEVKEQLKAIFRTVINNDKWITIHPNGEDGKGRPLLLKDGETPKEAIERTYGNGHKESKEERIEARRKHQEVVKKHNQAYKDFEDGKISMEELDKADKELEKSNKEFYGQPETKDKQSDTPAEKEGELKTKKFTQKMKSGKEKEYEYVDEVPKGFKKLEGAMTAPLGYTWYHNGKSIIDKERKTILVKDKVNNNKEQDMALLEEIKKLITKVENDKGADMEKTDKRKLIDEVAGIMKSAGCDDEDIRTAIGKMEKIGYDKSEAGTADNEKEEEKEKEKVENEETEEDEKEVEDLKKDVKKDVENKCKNSKEDEYAKMMNIYNASFKAPEQKIYVSREEKLRTAEEYFKA